jgi:hypothetical protein
LFLRSEIKKSHLFKKTALIDWIGVLQNGSMSSVAECQAHCLALPDCTHFTFYPELFRCYRKRGNAKTFKEGAISGTPAHSYSQRSCGSATASSRWCYPATSITKGFQKAVSSNFNGFPKAT